MQHRRAEWRQITRNFNELEFQCPCCGMVILDPQLPLRAQQLRNDLGRSVIVDSGYRCLAHNRRQGSSDGSYHRRGQAMDIRVPGVRPTQVAARARALGFGGVKAYSDFCHVDIGPRRTW